MDKIMIEILEDGEVRFETDLISGKNHASADEVKKLIEEYVGEVKLVEKKKVSHVHEHRHNHLHHKH